ncbi:MULTISPECIES: biotin carboxylase N-terminal domain-containing protein [Streptomyces]|uniref:Biotin carboxylase N-terminal domain-containing protein n=1 Tax=Streptomyces evansiae TaxID=3075535 RepID=A0ABU2QWJ7_9ACTN|nr:MULTISPECIES: biotin carboxylase N-terminal domain-containing protein [unclassified Streptomyces]MDT0408214.1 biotin carboxylase N-terminal domain-containing protein [Streptomyces sp. DSM 41979]MYQ58666.1 acetyl/propionyl-CoA carboxylase subunit alpha [Streptomyces sp. SID4926]
MTAGPRPVTRLLVANRGEIARRVQRTCRALGITTVAVHSDPDTHAPHTTEADLAVRLPGAAPADTYLRADLLLDAARTSGADAVHPGYGFLSENAAFARAVTDAGLTWIGPPPGAIAAMASKTRAKDLMARAGVPLLAAVDPAEATEKDLPLLLKAAAGGGGRGMRLVRDLADLPAQLTAARAEARAAFGDDEVFAEPYLDQGRHVEVQILADLHGTVWVLGTRDCSLQRRHQKVIEEAPAPRLPPALRESLHRAAEAAARAVAYTGAGTVEFLVDEDRAHFLEMNTRLQVEHPVTEAVHGVDLVALQIAVAEGEPLPPAPPAPSGHAVEARLYAEDPADDWRPRTGRLHRFRAPGHLRTDSGVTDGDTIGVHYDPLLAKLVAHAPTRTAALRALADGLARTTLHGPVTNRDLLVRTLRHPEVVAGGADTSFYDRRLAALTAPGDARAEELAALAAAVAQARTAARETGGLGGGWRNLPSAPALRAYRAEPAGTVHEIRYRTTRDGIRPEDHPAVTVEPETRPGTVHLTSEGVRRTYHVAVYGHEVYVDTPGGTSHALTALPRFPAPAATAAPGSLLAPLPGTVVRLAEGLAEGVEVAEGAPLLWLEAMKMEHRVSAPRAGVLTRLPVEAGRQVEVGTLLAVIEDAEPAPETHDTARPPKEDPAP